MAEKKDEQNISPELNAALDRADDLYKPVSLEDSDLVKTDVKEQSLSDDKRTTSFAKSVPDADYAKSVLGRQEAIKERFQESASERQNVQDGKNQNQETNRSGDDRAKSSDDITDHSPTSQPVLRPKTPDGQAVDNEAHWERYKKLNESIENRNSQENVIDSNNDGHSNDKY